MGGGRVILACVAIAAVGVVYGYFLHRNHLFPYRLLNPAAEMRPPIDPMASRAYRMRTSFFRAYPEQADIVMVGDSLTEAAEWDAIFPKLDIANQGISSDTTVGLLRRLKPVARTGARTVALMIGLNDLQLGEPVEDTYRRYMRAVDFLAAGRRLLAESVLPTRRGDALNARIAELNRRIKAACHDGGRCTYVDVGAAVAPDGVLPADRTIDGTHLTGAAYRLWAQALRPYLAPP
jgi:lysophospholipase L1-like esterase